MIHPHTDLRVVNEHIGFGVFASQFIPKGTIVYAKDALEIEVQPNDPRLLNPALEPIISKYSYIDGEGVRIISWDNAKFVNHCCDCNTLSTGYGFEIAVRDIQPGEEITDDYGMFNIERDMTCYCGSANCRGVIRAADFDHHAPRWDALAMDALKRLEQVEQPLLGLLDRSSLNRLRRFLRQGRGYVSVAALKSEPAVVASLAS